MMLRAILVLAVALWTWAWAHEITFSHLDIYLNPSATQIEVQLPIKALLQEQPSPLPAGTTEQTLRSTPLSAEEQSSLAKLLKARLRLVSSSQTLPLSITAVQTKGDDVALSVTAGPVLGKLEVEANLFPGDALHKVFVSVYRQDALVGQYALDRQDASFTLASVKRPLREIIGTFLREGTRHIFIGPDHVLFVLALILLGGSLWAQLKIMTAFTVAHSITLALATLNIVHPPTRLVESLIALSIVVVGLHDLWRLRSSTVHTGRDLRMVFAFFFGLIHGFGFASVLRQLGLPQDALAWSLAAFNVGVEVGQLLIVGLAAPVLLVLARLVRPQLSRVLFSAIAGGVVLVGVFWFWERIVL